MNSIPKTAAESNNQQSRCPKPSNTDFIDSKKNSELENSNVNLNSIQTTDLGNHTPKVVINGSNESAIVYTDELDDESRKQISMLLETKSAIGSHIRIMPDVHAGTGCVIGFTSHLTNWIIPNVIGVDIGCGVTAWRIGKPTKWESNELMYESLDKFIRKNIPSGFNTHSSQPLTTKELSLIYSKMINRNTEPYAPATYPEFGQALETLRKKINTNSPFNSLGTLGGGNHFMEINKEPSTGDFWFVVHTGSRNIGKITADFHQDYAFQLKKLQVIDEIKRNLTQINNAASEEKDSSDLADTGLSRENGCEIVLEYLKKCFEEVTNENFDSLSPQQAIKELEDLVTNKANNSEKKWQIDVSPTVYSDLSEYVVQLLSLEGNKRAINSTRRLISTFCIPSKNSAIKKTEILALCIKKDIAFDKLKIPQSASETDELTGEAAEAYKCDMRIAQLFAKLNRRVIIYIIAVRFFGVDPEQVPFLAEKAIHGSSISDFGDFVESVHNYIDFSDNIVRKGSISAHKGEKVIIPLSMQQGVILGVGKGNEEWNCSAPHGAGRKMSRGKARKTITLDQFQKDMSGIWTSCVNNDTIDEAPRAYKDANKIADFLKDTVDQVSWMYPVFNFKAGAD